LRSDAPAVNAADPQAPYQREPGCNDGRADLGAYGNSWEAPQNPPLSQMGAELTADTTTATERSGQAVQYNLTLKNSGAVPDNYTVTVMESTFSVRTAADGYGGPRQFTLIPQETVSIPIWVDVPLAPTQLDNTVIIRAFNGYGIDETIELTTSVRVFQEVGGQVVMEGENFDGQTERGTHTWLVQDSLTGYVGAGYAAALPDTDLLLGADYATTSSELSYTINFTTPGTYTVWLRGYAPNGAGDSLYIALDNEPAAIVTDFAPRIWAWGNKDNAGLPVTIEVSEAGVHTLHLWQREDGFRLDRIMLTTDNGYNPTGDGPSESPIQ
jgi:hypothetical protein